MTSESTVNLGPAAGEPLVSAAAAFGRWSLGTLLGLLCGVAMLVTWRWLAEALLYPLPTPALLCVGVFAAAAALTVRLMWRSLAVASERSRLGWLVAILPSAAILALGAALSLPGTAAGGLIAFWAVLVAEELWAWRPTVWRWLRRGRAMPSPVRLDLPEAPSPHALPTESPEPGLPSAAAALLDPRPTPPGFVRQQLPRSGAADGSEQLSGWLRMPFSAGQRTASVHVAFCPPFAKTPELAVEQLDGPPTRIKTALLLPHGARMDLKLSATAKEPTAVLLQFSVCSKPPA